MRINILFLFISIVLLAGCGKIVTVELKKGNNKLNEVATYNGVLTYAPKAVAVTYKFTKLEENGKIVGSVFNNKCESIKIVEFETHPDYKKPYLIRYEPGILSDFEFGITLSNGVVTGINAKSTSQISETIKSISELADKIPLAKSPPETTLPDCNAGKRLVSINDIN